MRNIPTIALSSNEMMYIQSEEEVQKLIEGNSRLPTTLELFGLTTAKQLENNTFSTDFRAIVSLSS